MPQTIIRNKKDVTCAGRRFYSRTDTLILIYLFLHSNVSKKEKATEI